MFPADNLSVTRLNVLGALQETVAHAMAMTLRIHWNRNLRSQRLQMTGTHGLETHRVAMVGLLPRV